MRLLPTIGILAGLLSAACATAAGIDTAAATDTVDSPLAAALPVSLEGIELRDARGGRHTLTERKNDRALALVFLGVDCPLAKLYAPRLQALTQEYEPRGVRLLAIDANQHDSLAELGEFVRRHGVTFPLLKDVGNVLADRLNVLRTPEVVLLERQSSDGKYVVRYQGRIDDQSIVGARRNAPTRQDLRLAIEELLAGQRMSVAKTEATGCLISRVCRVAPHGSITFAQDIAPIIDRHCVACHRPGQIAPFALTSYDDVAHWAETIREVIDEGRMPPWHASPQHGHFANDPSLTDDEKHRLKSWIEHGCPAGDAAKMPATSSESEEWLIGRPDLVLQMPKPFDVPAEGIIEYQFFEVDPGFREDRWVSAAEVRPGNRAVVHHCNVFLKGPGEETSAVEDSSFGSYCLAALGPGTPPMELPTGMAKLVPAGWRIVFVVHYTSIGTPQTDRTSLGLKFAPAASVKQQVATLLEFDGELCIPPHAADHRVEKTYSVAEDALLLAMFPHMHLRGKSFRYEAVYPCGRREILLDIPRYDFNWQNRYVLAEPKRLPAGTVLHFVAHYDNSADNPANPDPNATVRAGTQSWDEMFNAYFDLALADEDRTQPWYPLVRAIRDARRVVARNAGLLAVGLIGCLVLARRLKRHERAPGCGREKPQKGR